MKRKDLLLFSVLFCFLTSALAAAETPPSKVVQQFIEAHLRGRFAEAHGFALERANLHASLFSNWLFAAGDGSGDAGTADVFLSRKFAEAFRYSIIGTAQSGENQVYVTVKRTSPNMVHLYTWALAPKRGAPPYDLIEAIDTYLTKVNFPVEDSRMQFTLIREAEEWYISAIHDEKFARLQEQWLSQPPLGAAAAAPGVVATPSAGAPVASTPTPMTTTSSSDFGRQMADAQFNATLQSFNRTYQPPVSGGASPAKEAKDEAEHKSFLGRVGGFFGLGGKGKTAAQVSDTDLKSILNSIRDAMARYTTTHSDRFPDAQDIYDWKSLRRLVNQYGKRPLPATEAEVGFTFVNYSPDINRNDYRLLIELHEPLDGNKRVEVTPNGFDRAG